ncbi:MAG: hypothetical protein HWN69_09545 [Desulfobacterales bacterium]|nr:hypothetical protein [Desulfobacterales bacterium]
MRTKKRCVPLFCLLFVSAIFFVTSQASAALTADDVANQVKEAMVAGATAKDAVNAAIIFAIAEGMPARKAAAAATEGALDAAIALGLNAEEMLRVVYGASQGARAAAEATGQNLAAVKAGVKSAALLAARTHGLDPRAMIIAADAGAVDTTEAEAYSPPEMGVKPLAMPARQHDPVEPMPDPKASPR